MQFIRTIVWIIITIVLVAFIAMNWNSAEVNFWPMADGQYLHFNWPVGFIALVFFLLGLLPMWLLARFGKWRLNRKINALEKTVQEVAPAAPAPPIATSTQLDAHSMDSPVG